MPDIEIDLSGTYDIHLAFAPVTGARIPLTPAIDGKQKIYVGTLYGTFIVIGRCLGPEFHVDGVRRIKE